MSVNLSIKFIGMIRDISSEELILIYLGLTNTPPDTVGINLPAFNKYRNLPILNNTLGH